MRTVVHFIGADKSVALEESYDTVIKALQGREVGLFGENASRVAIYKAGVAYIEEVSERHPPQPNPREGEAKK